MRRAFAVVAVLLLLLALVPVPSGAVHETGREFRVYLQADGDAQVELYTEYDLGNESQRQRFEALANNETARQQARRTFRQRLDLGQKLAETETGRQMSIGDVSLNATRANETGIVRISAPWTNLAAVDGANDRLVVTAPFGHARFPINRTLVVFGPEGFTRGATDPLPNVALKNRAYWGGNANLAGFTATFQGPVVTPEPAAPSATATAAPLTGAGLAALFAASVFALVPTAVAVAAVRRASSRDPE